MAPTCATASAEAINVCAGTITSSPAPIPRSAQRQRECGRPGGHSDAVVDLAVLSETCFFQPLDLLAEDEAAARQHTLEGSRKLWLQYLMLALQRDQRDPCASLWCD